MRGAARPAGRTRSAAGPTSTRRGSSCPASLDLRDGRTLECYGAPVDGADGQSYGRVWYFRDVTERRRTARQILEAGERERQRIGQDLHDDLCQHLAGIACLGRVLHQRLAARLPDEAGAAARVVDLVEQAVRRARDIARGLQPLQLETDGLAVALQELAADVEQMFRRPVPRRVRPARSTIDDPATSIHLYRITQEAISNAIRHGRARERLRRPRARGGPADPDASRTTASASTGRGRPTPGLGMQTMRHRARMIGATLTVEPGDARRDGRHLHASSRAGTGAGRPLGARRRAGDAREAARRRRRRPPGDRVRVLLVDDHAAAAPGHGRDHQRGAGPGRLRRGRRRAERDRRRRPRRGPTSRWSTCRSATATGWSWSARCGSRFPDVRTLVLSMYDETVYAERALRAGARGYVMKAEAAKTVMAGDPRVLRGEVYLSPRMAAQLRGRDQRGGGNGRRPAAARRAPERPRAAGAPVRRPRA